MAPVMRCVAVTRCSKLPDYEDAVRRAGGTPIVVDRSCAPAEVLLECDAVLLTGGGDVDPAKYGEAPHAATSPAEPGRDDFEIALVKLARTQQIPVLAICRGIQVLNVACGGTLVQDIASQMPGALSHRLDVPPHQPMERAHEIWIDKDSQLSRIMRERLSDTDACDVNSRHHQAIRQVAPGFVVSATAPDGVIEAIEDPAARFCLGVQWHPENFFRTGEFRPLFESFLEATRK